MSQSNELSYELWFFHGHDPWPQGRKFHRGFVLEQFCVFMSYQAWYSAVCGFTSPIYLTLFANKSGKRNPIFVFVSHWNVLRIDLFQKRKWTFAVFVCHRSLSSFIHVDVEFKFATCEGTSFLAVFFYSNLNERFSFLLEGQFQTLFLVVNERRFKTHLKVTIFCSFLFRISLRIIASGEETKAFVAVFFMDLRVCWQMKYIWKPKVER